MRKILIVIDMQNDFIDGALGTKEAVSIIPNVLKKIKTYEPENIYATLDTHEDNYSKTQEGRFLPIPHCIRGTKGWMLPADIASLIPAQHRIEKPSFGSMQLAETMKTLAQQEPIQIELIGLCTDICVVSNALILKATLPETSIRVDPNCCAGVTPAAHQAALDTMQSCQVIIESS